VSLVFQAIRAGAFDILEKPFSPETLIASVRLALAEKGGDETRKAKSEAFTALLNSLNDTEKKVLVRIIAGKSSKVIALELGVNHVAAELHRASVMRKMNARNVAELMRMAFVAGRDAFSECMQT
jgi:FixJ family two-component response regulator